MNPDLLEALCALATACYFEARRCHPRLFVLGDDRRLLDEPTSVTDEEHAVLLVTTSIDALVEHLDDLRCAREASHPEFVDPLSDDVDDELPF